MDLSHGMARTIFAALKNFAEQSGHNDLSDSKLILLGFSGTGLLFARFVAYSPDRVVAPILTALGQGDPFGIEKVDLPDDALHVPELSSLEAVTITLALNVLTNTFFGTGSTVRRGPFSCKTTYPIAA